MGNITLAAAWPYLAGVFSFFTGIFSLVVWRYIDSNEKTHERIVSELHQQIHDRDIANATQHAEYYERIRVLEINAAAMRAEHDCNHE